MTKIQSGLVIAGVGIGMNLLGRIFPVASYNTVTYSSLLALWMVASAVLCLFGGFRIIVGAFSKKKRQKELMSEPPSKDTWPPPPKPPETV